MNTRTRNSIGGCRLLGIVLLTLAISVGVVNATTVWDLKKDWSETANPNGPWALKEGNNLLPAIPLSGWQPGNGWNSPQPGWARSASGNDRIPFWFRSNGTETFASDTLAGDIVVHSQDDFSGIGNSIANVTWTSPIAGTISLSGGVWMTRDIGRSNDWKIYKNAVLLSQGSISSGDVYNRASPFNFAAGSGGATAVQNVSVVIGDVIKLELVRTSAPGDFVGINFKITAGSVWNTGVGANGHTYIPVKVPGSITWQEAENAAIAAGGHLAGIAYAEENAFVYSLVSGDPQFWFTNGSGQAIGPWLGGYQVQSGTEPADGWQWTDGYGLDFTNWSAGEPGNQLTFNEDHILYFGSNGSPSSQWGDYSGVSPGDIPLPKGYIIEIGPGEGSSTVWNTGPGANGHSYQAVLTPGGITWPEAEAAAQARGGHLASISSADENAFVFALVSGRPEFWFDNTVNDGIGPWIGGYQPEGSPEPAGGWRWSDGSTFTFTHWDAGEPNNFSATENRVHLFNNSGGIGDKWNDSPHTGITRGYIIEFATTPGVPTGPEFADMLYVESSPNSLVYQFRIDPVSPPTLVRSLTDEMNQPTGLALAANGEMFVVQHGNTGASNARISRYLGANDNPVANGTLIPASPLMDSAFGATFRGNDLLVVDAGNNRVRRFQPDAGGTFVEQLPSITTGLTGGLARYVAVNPATQEVLVSHAGGPNKILRYQISGAGVVTSNGEITGNGISNPHFMVFSPWGEMFVTNFDGHSVSRFFFDSGGAAVPNGTITGNDLASPVGLAFSPWGELFVGNTTNQKISRFTFSETGVATANGTLTIPGPVGTLQFVNASAPVVPPPCVPGVTTSVSDGLIAWWKGDGDATDVTGNNNGTEENGVTYEPGRFGQAFRVGSNENEVDYFSPTPRVNLGHLPQLKGASAYSVSAWIKADFDPPGQRTLFYHLGLPVGLIPTPPNSPFVPANARGFKLLGDTLTDMQGEFFSYSSPFYSALFNETSLTSGAWRHFVGVWRSSDGFFALYLDGILKGNGHAPAGQKFPDGTADLVPGYIGAFGLQHGTSSVVTGSVSCLFDDVRIYTRDLTPEEIQLIATGDDFNTCPPPDTGFPPLTAASVPAGVRVAWPSRFTGWALETSTDAINWTPVTGTPLLEASEFSLTTSASPVRKFFRLRRSGN